MPVDLPKDPVPGEHYWLTQEEMASRWAVLAKDPYNPSCLWCGIMRRADGKNRPCPGRVGISLR